MEGYCNFCGYEGEFNPDDLICPTCESDDIVIYDDDDFEDDDDED